MCACEHHRDSNARCTCLCPSHHGVRQERARLDDRAEVLRAMELLAAFAEDRAVARDVLAAASLVRSFALSEAAR